MPVTISGITTISDPRDREIKTLIAELVEALREFCQVDTGFLLSTIGVDVYSYNPATGMLQVGMELAEYAAWVQPKGGKRGVGRGMWVRRARAAFGASHPKVQVVNWRVEEGTGDALFILKLPPDMWARGAPPKRPLVSGRPRLVKNWYTDRNPFRKKAAPAVPTVAVPTEETAPLLAPVVELAEGTGGRNWFNDKPGALEAVLDDIFGYGVVGKPWPDDFPKITALTTGEKMKGDGSVNAYRENGKNPLPIYDAAKHGDAESAVKLAKILIGKEQKQKILGIAEKHPDAIVCALTAKEEAGNNQIPAGLRNAISDIGNLKNDKDIVQTNKVGHTGEDMDHRLAFRSQFGGPVVKGGEYILVDDFTTSGASLSDLRDYIEHNGGRVVNMLSYGVGRDSFQIALTEKTLLDLEAKFGHDALYEFLAKQGIHGGTVEALTEREARHILGWESLDDGKARLDAARSKKVL